MPRTFLRNSKVPRWAGEEEGHGFCVGNGATGRGVASVAQAATGNDLLALRRSNKVHQVHQLQN